MSESHYIVSLRAGSWQHSNRGTTSAPFKTRDAAIEAAIEEARASGDSSAVVIVQEPETSTQTVWRWGQQSGDPV